MYKAIIVMYESTKSMSNFTQRLLALAIAITLTFTLSAQINRSIDGSGNNVLHPDWGAAGSLLDIGLTTVGYADGISEVTGQDRPNPRVISNALLQQNTLIDEPLQLSDFVWVFGQFIDHDIVAVHDGVEPAMIDVPMGDEQFDPFARGDVKIPMHRSAQAPGTGTSTNNPRNHRNDITAFIDGSGVYGSDETRADWLRTYNDGKLKVSAGNLLPYNTVNQQRNGTIASGAPFMDNPVGLTSRLFVAGDIRANENILLLSFHTLFVREHNLLCDELALRHPDWNDEQLYQYARKMVGGIIQSITYNEWLPVMGVHIPAYRGYDSNENPAISNVFSAAAFRMGHTLLSSELMRVDNNGHEIPQGNILLRDAFFNPDELHGIGIDPYFMGMAIQVQQSLDSKVVEDVRSFLFGAPGSGGLDLAAANINRGRERGLADFNTIRRDIGLTPYRFINDMVGLQDDSQVLQTLHALYQGDVNNIDAWVGMLAERRMPNAIFGPTIMRLMETQFRALRDGDRYYFENDLTIDAADRAWLRDIRLADIIRRNTTVDIPHEEVFRVLNPEVLCAGMQVDGSITTEDGTPLDNIELLLTSSTNPVASVYSDASGTFLFESIENCFEYELTPDTEGGDPLRGISTFDLIMLQKHILGIDPLGSPYQLLAADVNGSGDITTFDIIELRKLILGIQSQFPTGRNWYFIDASYTFTNPSNPFDEDFPEISNINSENNGSIDFIGVKLGDLDGSSANNFGTIGERAAEIVDVSLEYSGTASDGYEHFYLTVEDFEDVSGFQFTLDYDETVLELVEMNYGDVRELSAANFNHVEAQGAITTSWHQSGNADLEATGVLVELVFKSNQDIESPCDLIAINSAITKSEVYLASRPNIRAALGLTCKTAMVELYQNYPNPFDKITSIPFRLASPMTATLSVYDVSGKLLYSITNEYTAGKHEVQVERNMLSTEDNVAIYRLETENGVIGKKMILLD